MKSYISENIGMKEVNRAYIMLGFLNCIIRCVITIPTFVSLYKSLVRSRLGYCCPVWSLYRKEDIKALEKVQKTATKTIPEFRNVTYRDCCKACNMSTVHYR